jgi:hypothetical protein
MKFWSRIRACTGASCRHLRACTERCYSSVSGSRCQSGVMIPGTSAPAARADNGQGQSKRAGRCGSYSHVLSAHGASVACLWLCAGALLLWELWWDFSWPKVYTRNSRLFAQAASSYQPRFSTGDRGIGRETGYPGSTQVCGFDPCLSFQSLNTSIGRVGMFKASEPHLQSYRLCS